MKAISLRKPEWIRRFGVTTFAALLAGLTSLNGLDRDQCISYLAGLREVSGQTIYQSYFIPHGPVAGLVFSLFLRILPTGGWALIAGSATLNALAALVVGNIVKKTTQSESAAVSAGLLTAIWFLPVFGAYYHDHLAYFWGLLALWCWLEEGVTAAIFSGALITLAFHTKQTVGLAVLIGFALALAFTHPKATRYRLSAWIAGFLLCHVVVLGTLWLKGVGQNYFLYNFVYAWHFSSSAPAEKGWLAVLTGFLLPFHINPVLMIAEGGWGRLAFYPVVMAIYLAYASALKNRPSFSLVFALFSTVIGGSLLGRLHAHLFLGMGIVIVLLSYRSLWSSSVVATYAALGLLYVFVLHGRIVPTNPYYASTDLAPLRIGANSQSLSNEQILRYLRSHPGEYALIGDSSDLIPLALRKSPWNPSVNFTQLTIPKKPTLRKRWESDFLAAVSSHDVKQIVIARKFLEVFPLIRQSLETEYLKIFESEGEPLLLFQKSS